MLGRDSDQDNITSMKILRLGEEQLWKEIGYWLAGEMATIEEVVGTLVLADPKYTLMHTVL